MLTDTSKTTYPESEEIDFLYSIFSSDIALAVTLWRASENTLRALLETKSGMEIYGL